MKVDAYLERIHYRGSREPTAETLRQLHRAHMASVPFENLDIPLGNPIVLSRPLLYDKIVGRRRGGFCYELNGLLAWLLEQLGFACRMLSARVFDGAEAGPDFDHMLLQVDLEERWIADVGFGDNFLEPLPLHTGDEVRQAGVGYRLTGTDSAKRLEKRRAADWEPQYLFTLTPRRLADFGPMCHHHQTSPESIFTRKSICSRVTPEGRISLSNGRLITTGGGQRQERPVADEPEYRVLLQTHFGMEIDTDLTALLSPGSH